MSLETGSELCFQFEFFDGIDSSMMAPVLLSRRPQCLARSQPVFRRLFSSNQTQNHYEVLGVARTATPKEIKSAYYVLSKKYHPDIIQGNGGDKDNAEKFQQVAAAYEVLGSQEKRRAYDATITPQRHTYTTTGRASGFASSRPSRQYTDTDIDLKTFEHFQRSTRMRQKFHDRWEMPDEFFAEFGGRKFKSRYGDEEVPKESNYKDSRAAERELKERKLQAEIEREREKQRYPMPTFEQLLRQQEERKAQEQRSFNITVGLIAFVVLSVATLVKLRIFIPRKADDIPKERLDSPDSLPARVVRDYREWMKVEPPTTAVTTD